MKPEIEHYIREQGWVFAGISQPEHRRIWARIETDADGKFKRIERIENEDYLAELASNIIG